MANRDNHYEAAFEAYLRQRQVPYIAVDEARRALLADGRSIKSLDFLVSAPGGGGWLIDVKGRRFPGGDDRKDYWKNWSPKEDVESLRQWEDLFGGRFRGLFVFAYNIVGDLAPLPPEQLFEHRGSIYGFVAVALADYAECVRLISPRWDTVGMSATDFRRIARPADEFLLPLASPPESFETFEPPLEEGL